jgi:anthranilate synthase component II
MILVLDNYDSFTFNLVQYLGTLGAEVCVRRNDEISVSEAQRFPLSGIVLSPGPGRPAEAGNLMEMIRAFAGRVPILGICLGHQAIGEVFGAKLVRASRPVHGKASRISHDGEGVFAGLPQTFSVGRYHSLTLQHDSVAQPLVVSASSEDGVVMGIRHCQLSIEGVQFHPESILTEQGLAMLANFLRLCQTNICLTHNTTSLSPTGAAL